MSGYPTIVLAKVESCRAADLNSMYRRIVLIISKPRQLFRLKFTSIPLLKVVSAQGALCAFRVS